jgi:pimeloyl-ACP methyl ester carboxylesterase
LILLCPGVPNFGPPTRQYAIHGMPLILFPSRLTGRWLIQGLSIRGYQPDDLEAEQLIVSALSLRSRIPFRPVFGADEFGNLNMSVLLLVGDREILYDAESAIARARELIPHLEAEIIPDAGHMLATDQPEAVISRALQFLQDAGRMGWSQSDRSKMVRRYCHV